jgi:membrane protein CcdC involved in cytochrome C biogenesis
MSHITVKLIDSIIPLATAVMGFLIYFRVIPIKKDEVRDDIAYTKFGKFFLFIGMFLLLITIIKFF